MNEEDKFKMESTHPIEELYVFISKDKDGGEAVMVVQGNAGWFPLIGSDLKRALSLRPVAETIAERYGRAVRLCKFSNRKEITLRHLGGLKKERGHYEDGK